MVELLARRFISQNSVWVRETLLSIPLPVTWPYKDGVSTLSSNSSVPTHLGG